MAVAFLQSIMLTALSVPALAVLQSGGYKPTSLVKLVNTAYFCSLCLLQTICLALHFVCYQHIWVFTTLLVGIVAICFFVESTTLKYTARAIRLLVCVFAIYFAICWLSALMFTLAPLVCCVAVVINAPLESVVKAYYLCKARKKLASTNAIKIGITGSFGKTSVKQILCQLLPNAVATPSSFNTPMGIAKFVNSTNFDGKQYIIFEMGARKKGDIAKLCKLVCPTVAVLTGITAQHLETFKTLQAVIDTKCELLNYLSQDDLCVINGFDAVAKQCFGVGVSKQKLCPNPWESYTLDAITLKGTTFTLNAAGSKVQFCSSLFGVAHFHNVALCICVALALGCKAEELVSKVSSLQPVKHRLEVISGNGVTVIDDGYNANLQGVERACQSISYLHCRKVVVSQGIVECGKDSATINRTVGKLLDSTFDVVVACGPNAKQILSGVTEGKGYFATDLSQAVGIARQHFDDNIVCLFQNDIPQLF